MFQEVHPRISHGREEPGGEELSYKDLGEIRIWRSFFFLDRG